MEPRRHNEGSSKKKGLARRAKNHSLSNSLNNLHMEGRSDEKDVKLTSSSSPLVLPVVTVTPSCPTPPPDSSSPHTSQKAPDSPGDQQASPLRNFSRQSTAAVTLLPNKMNVSELSGQQQLQQQTGERRARSVQEESLSLDSASIVYVPCSDPDFIRNPKSNVRGTQSCPVAASRNSVCGGEQLEGHITPGQALRAAKLGRDSLKKLSPLLPRRAQLAPPQVKRSSSMTRLTEAFNQLHNVCLFPAHPTTMVEKSEEMPEKRVHKSSSAELEVNGSVPLTPLTATTNSRTDQMYTQSPKLVRRTAFRETVKEHRKNSHDSSVMCASPTSSGSVVFTLGPAECVHSPSVSSQSCVSYDPDSKDLENGFDAPHPTTCTKQPSTSSKASGASSEASGCSSRNARGRRKSQTKEGKKARQKSAERSGHAPEANSGSPSLKHASSAPYSLMSEDDGVFRSDAPYPHPALEQSRLNRSPSWSGYKVPGKSTTDSSDPTEGCRSASLDELTNIGVSYGLPIISPIDAKKKNYLFGGLNSLLGASELDRYFPTRTINLFIATWNMNGKEPPANLEAFLLPDEMEHMPDMFVLGTQESGGSRTEWEVRLQATIGPSHVLFTSAIFGVLHLTIFLRRDLIWFCSVPEEATYSLRPGIAYKTKGGVGIGFQFFGTRILFINSHLTAHEEKQAYRIQNFKSISRSLDIPRLLPVKFKHKDVTHRYDCVFWLGDLNFRLAVNRDHVFERLKQGGPDTYQHLLQWDQLSQARQKGEAFSEFEEGSISFPPTFKYDPGTDHYDTSSKQRVPSYTDRILFKSKRGDITCSTYDYCPLFRTSDHKPVMGTYTCKIRPGKDDVPLAAGTFNRDVYLEALRRRRKFLYQPALRNCPVQ
ncbi:phosphatidylinositol polyphosphate 5-phosphatase type IV-like isoform X2 [Eriocheir sinensis]|uniref:phosphatidylinositol polyphosphate 5-phosphatase type IV-like isoform X2 n=1 Tax=Eriocheir sinensis TaxID=95602 RepID=UPI0021C6D024|nr:phosphatidylinositol polyphosphate 5-phosphatase type IV-like isoform X2 [Eriocheir sinensis]